MTKISFVLKVFLFIELASCQQNPNFNEGILDIRIIGPGVPREGGVEVAFTDEVEGDTVWLPVCRIPNHGNDEVWGKDESRVACRQLKYQGGWPYTYLNQNNADSIAIDDVRCMGDESLLSECAYDGEGFLTDSQCGIQNQAGVQCYDNTYVRLVDSPSNRPYQGVVEVRYNVPDTDWMEVCYQGGVEWTINNAKVVCSQLGYPGVMKTYQGIYYRADEIQSVDSIDCEGSEASIGECFVDPPRESSCDPENKVEVICFLPGYSGCFSEQNGPILPLFPMQDTSMTIVKCHDHCRSQGQGYIYAGLIGGTQCRCGTTQDIITSGSPLSDDECSAPRSGEEFLTCGGENRIAIYRVNSNVCDDPGTQLNSERTGDSFAFGSTVTYTCDSNANLIGESTIQCIMGDTVDTVRWNASPPVCQGIPTTTVDTTTIVKTHTPLKLIDGAVDHPVDIGLLTGIIAAALLLIVLIIAVICFVIRRKKMDRQDNIAATDLSSEMVYPSPVFDPVGEVIDNAYFNPAMAQAAAASYPDYEDFAPPEKGANYDPAVIEYGAAAAVPPSYYEIPEKKIHP